MKTGNKDIEKFLTSLEERNKKIKYRKDHFYEEVLGIREIK